MLQHFLLIYNNNIENQNFFNHFEVVIRENRRFSLYMLAICLYVNKRLLVNKSLFKNIEFYCLTDFYVVLLVLYKSIKAIFL